MLIGSSNNQAPPPTTLSFSAMSSDNDELSDDLVGDFVYKGASIESLPESSTKSHLNQDHLSRILNSRVVNRESS